jgi:hypothetical protein
MQRSVLYKSELASDTLDFDLARLHNYYELDTVTAGCFLC